MFSFAFLLMTAVASTTVSPHETITDPFACPASEFLRTTMALLPRASENSFVSMYFSQRDRIPKSKATRQNIFCAMVLYLGFYSRCDINYFFTLYYETALYFMPPLPSLLSFILIRQLADSPSITII